MKITKTQLRKIIKEEFTEVAGMSSRIDQESVVMDALIKLGHDEPEIPGILRRIADSLIKEEIKDTPQHLTVGAGSGGDRVALHRLQGMLYSLRDDFVPYLDGTEEHEMYGLVKELMKLLKGRMA